MARGYYSSYSSRRGRRQKLIYNIITVVVILALVVFFFVRRRKNDAAEDEPAVKQPTAAQPAKPEKISVAPNPVAVKKPEPVAIKKPEPKVVAPVSVTAEDTAKLDPAVADILNKAKENISAGRIIAARDLLNDILRTPLPKSVSDNIKLQLSGLADKWLFSADTYPDDTLCANYKVKPGDILARIGKDFKVPAEILLEINNIPRPEAMRAGETIKVINGPFHTVVYKSTFTLDLYLQNTYIRSYSVGLGKTENETPTGLWSVKSGGKMVKPQWTDPTGRVFEPDDTDYPLGSRWIEFDGLEGNAKGRTGFAFHGTKDPDTIGTKNSNGCIRLFNGDVIEIYNLLVENHSQVRVVD